MRDNHWWLLCRADSWFPNEEAEMIRFVVFAMVLVIGGCTTTREVYFADGSNGHLVGCYYAYQSFGSCLVTAGDICEARGFQVVNQQGEAVPFAVGSRGYIAQSGWLFVKCR